MKEKLSNKLHSIETKDIIIFLIPLIICLIMLIIYYPGIYNFDVFNQLWQIENNEFSTGHPFISTFYIMIFHKYIGIHAALPIFQILWFSLLCSLICKYCRKDNNKKSNFIFQIIIIIFISINPLINLSIISNNKDTFFLLTFISICYFLLKIIVENFANSNKDYILLGMFLVLFGKIRHNGRYTFYIFLILFFIILLVKLIKKDKIKLLSFITSIIIFSVILSIPQKLYNVKMGTNNATGMGTIKALQLDGYLYRYNILTKDEIQKLSTYVNMQSLYNQSYNTSYLDPLILVEKTKKYDEDQKGFINLNKNILFNHLSDSFKFYLASCPIIWRITLPEYIMHSYLWIDIDTPNRSKSINYKMKDTSIFKKTDTTIRKLQDNKIMAAVFYSPATYFYISIIISIILVIIYRNYSWLLFIFNTINVGILSLSIPVQDTRYLLNTHGLVLILSIYLINIITKRKAKV